MNPVAEFLQSPEGLEFLKRLLEEKLTVEFDTSRSGHESSTWLEINVKFDDCTVASTSCYIS